MTSTTEISVAQLSRLIGLPDTPALIDVRTDEDYAADPRLLPGAVRRSAFDTATLSKDLDGRSAVVICQRGAKLSQGAAAWLRHDGSRAETLEGGFEAWREAKQLLLDPSKLPTRAASGHTTVWVTRARPKIDRIACPWLIRRFVDRKAVFLFVAPSEVIGVAERFSATAFDVEGVFWSHRKDACTFDTMIEELALDHEALRRMAKVVRGADTARHDLAPEAAGLLAISLGLSRMYRDDLEQLEAAMPVYDGLYRWARDATGETHNWPASTPGR